MTTVGVTNMTQACIDGISDTVAGMQTTTDPYASQTESLATSGAGEIQRLRFMIGRMFGLQDWYRHDQNVNFAHAGGGVNVQGAGLGRHVTAVGYHSWGGSARFPAITGGYVHTTGFFWPAAHHIAISVDPAIEADKAGVELIRIHARGLTLHHTAAIRFWHSTGGSTATSHITALAISRGLATMAGNEAFGRDNLLVGHATTVLRMVGYGQSHIGLGTHSSLQLGRHTLAGTRPWGNALYADLIPKVWLQFTGDAANAPINGSFNVRSLTDDSTGTYTVTFDQPFVDANYACSGAINQAGSVGFGTLATGSMVISTWNDAGVATDFAAVHVICFGRQ